MACVAPEGLDKAAWGAKLIQTADLASSVSFASHLKPNETKIAIYIAAQDVLATLH